MKTSIILRERPHVGPVVEHKSVKSVRALAILVMRVLDKQNYRGGRPIEYRDQFSDGLVRIHRDSAGRVYFRVPRLEEASIRLNPSRTKLLLSRNLAHLEEFFDKNPLIVQCLNEGNLKAAMKK